METSNVMLFVSIASFAIGWITCVIDQVDMLYSLVFVAIAAGAMSLVTSKLM